MSRINKDFFKKGNGAAWLGLSFIVLIFFFCILFVNYYNWYDAMIKTQTHTDALADAMAVSANNGTGVPDERAMLMTRDQMEEKLNEVSDTKITSVAYDRELLYGIDEDNGDKILKLTTKTSTPLIESSFFYNNSTHSYLRRIRFTGNNTTKMLIDPTAERNYNFRDDIRYRVESETRNGSGYVPLDRNLYRNIIMQFYVDRTRRYLARNGETREDVYLWDVTTALGCELPFYYKSLDGSPWDPDSSGYIEEGGLSTYHLLCVRDNGGYLEHLKAHIPDLQSYYHVGSAVAPISWEKYSNWNLVGHSSDIWTLRQIQSKANNGYPTILLFESGMIWIVVPELDASGCERGLLVSFASNVPSNAAAAMASNAYVNNVVMGYRQPLGNFVALTYGG